MSLLQCSLTQDSAAAAPVTAAVAGSCKTACSCDSSYRFAPFYTSNTCHLQALLKNARANSSKAGSTAALAPDTDIGIGARGLLDRWTESPAHKTFAQAYAEGSGCLNAAVAA